jgi:hypothetical protein
VKIEINSYEEEQGPILDEGVPYEATVSGFAETENQWGPRLVWRFDVEDPESGETVEAAAFTSYSTADGKKVSNLTKFAKNLNGGEMPVDENGNFDTDLLVGKSGRVITSTYTRKNGIVKNVVNNVLPSKATAAV